MTDTTPATAPDDDHGGAAPKDAVQDSRFALTARDLFTVAIFAVLYVIAGSIVAMLGIAGPLVMMVTLPLAPLVCGIPYMLFLTRVHRPGMVTLFGVVSGLLYLLYGLPWMIAIATTVLGAIADLICARGGYRSRPLSVVAYTVFSLWYVATWIPFFLSKEEYIRSQGMQEMGDSYAADFDRLVTTPVVLASAGAMVLCAALGGLLGTTMLKKHFTRAGLA
ncbi:MAG: MptD family putative ECF transporter S component [Gordonia sp. (in: high G+C Gram-positive bacteria)]|uniref:MptD family putative ECF transporter S component n=1 Tax=Gordonia sp. (in: high G+C Gram-positive bacteria) TaxID=84139 RepID=UPI0039E70E17